ncbi:DUF883 family protein [Paraburkholderia sp. 1N]|uniref:DUF883 family protein n=1 Tax=Paraburkholderia solitsugae TaxID=2675748 RepID=A0ABX2BK62_9BURK|nr:DUF883 family protein [Paraburkholderia solitsugae]
MRVLLRDPVQSTQRRYRAATVNTERYVRRNPWRSIGIAAGVGLLRSVLSTR